VLINLEDQVTYPKFTRYVRDSLPAVANIKSVQRAFLEYAQLDRTTLKRALQWGFAPVLCVVDIVSPAGKFRNGFFTKGTHIIKLNRLLVQAYEDGTPPDLAFSHTASGAELPRVGVTILHELVHWGDNQDGVDYGVDTEEGNLFEVAVYGANIKG
jgi:hypothetical protein